MDSGNLLLMALVYLTAGVIAVPVAQRLGLGSVLGYLAAGTLIGPSVLSLVGDQAAVLHFSEFGVVIMLFLIGLDVRPSALWSMRTAFLGLGGAQVVVTGLVLSGVGLVLGLAWPTALALGFILSLSSTAIVMQTFEESGLRKTAAGTAAFGILLFQDVSIIPMIAVLPLLAASGGGTGIEETGLFAGLPGWVHAAGVLAAVAVVILGGRLLARPILRLIARARSREIFTAAALLIVVAVALLMEEVGLSASLGAFLAGVVLADSEFRREIEADIEPFRGLLLGLFFMSVGANLDLGIAAAQPMALAAFVIGLMCVKAAVIFGVARAFGVHKRAAALTAAALAQGGEFAFVLLGLASAAGVVPASISALATAAVAVSMALTPFALKLYERICQEATGPLNEPENDPFDDQPDVIIAGFGRFGQIVARLLIVNGFRTSVLEASADQVDLVRRFGRRVHYGDATRLDLLRSAGADDAKIMIIAIDDRDQAETLVELVRDNFPHLKILARAYDRRHAYRLLAKGADTIERETFEGGLGLGEQALKVLGLRSDQAKRATRLFRKHDERMFKALQEVWNDEEQFTVVSRESSAQMDELLSADVQQMMLEPAPLVAEDEIGPSVEHG